MEFSLFKEEFKHIIKTEADPSESNQKQNDPPLMSCKIENDTFYPHFYQMIKMKFWTQQNHIMKIKMNLNIPIH